MPDEEKKRIIVKKTTAIPSKKTTTKVIPSTTANTPEEAPVPVNPDVAGWKKRFEDTPLQSKHLKTKEETWIQRKNTMNTTKRKKGLVIFIYAKAKAGKSHLECTASKSQGYEGKHRIIPRGYPTYILDTEYAVQDEAEVKFSEQLDAGNIIIEPCFEINSETQEVDPIPSMDKMEAWAKALANETDGTLCIDTFTDYCDWTYYKMVDKVLGIGFNENGIENKHPMPLQYQWRTKKAVTFLRMLRTFGMNIIIIAQAKDETEQTGTGAMDYRKTGDIVADAEKKSAFWMDIIAKIEKFTDPETEEIKRVFTITDSRFESLKQKQMVLEDEAISFDGIINLIKDVL